jgi:hypothetical protein
VFFGSLVLTLYLNPYWLKMKYGQVWNCLFRTRGSICVRAYIATNGCADQEAKGKGKGEQQEGRVEARPRIAVEHCKRAAADAGRGA